MKITRILAAISLCVLAAATVSASGRIGYYGIIERVTFELSEAALKAALGR